MNLQKVLLFAISLSSSLVNAQPNASFELLERSIDSVVMEGLDSMAYPGAQVLIWYKDTTILHKTYGYHTYDRLDTVKKDDFYDLASVTKVTSGIPVLMKLYGEGKFDLDAPLKTYMPEFKRSNKKDLTFREMLAHQSGMEPYIVFWQNTIKKNGKFKKRTFKDHKNKRFPIQITEGLYLHRRYQNKMRKAIKKSNLRPERKFLYSGLLFQVMPTLIENITGSEYNKYLNNNIYNPLDIKELMYNPSEKVELSRIIPTENDTFLRHTLVRGQVHDEAAAMFGGISCNAGLFGTAGGLLQLFKYYIHPWEVNGSYIIEPAAIHEFTTCQYPENENHRGLGFDKPLLQFDEERNYIAPDAPSESFGHSGFTGTFVWADPKNDLIVIFLSNRVYPYRSHRQLYSMGIRGKLHQLAYNMLVN